MRRSLGAGQVGGGPWLMLSERGSSQVLDQLLTQERVDLEPEPLWALFPSPRLGSRSEDLERGQSAELPPPL